MERRSDLDCACKLYLVGGSSMHPDKKEFQTYFNHFIPNPVRTKELVKKLNSIESKFRDWTKDRLQFALSCLGIYKNTFGDIYNVQIALYRRILRIESKIRHQLVIQQLDEDTSRMCGLVMTEALFCDERAD